MARLLLPAPSTMVLGAGARRLARGVTRGLATRMAALSDAGARLAGIGQRLAYRRQELGVAVLLVASVLGGAAVEAWRRRDPGALDRLEAEPPRLGPRTRRAPSPSAPRRDPVLRGGVAGCCGLPPPDRPGVPPPTAATPLDLNQATPAELGRLPGIGPRLAERIIRRREALGGWFPSAEELATVPGLGRRRAALIRPLVTATPPPARDGAAPETGAPPAGGDATQAPGAASSAAGDPGVAAPSGIGALPSRAPPEPP